MSIFKNRTVIGIICILLALVICFGITPLFNQSISQKAEIVRVTKDIHAGELITKDMVTTTEVGSYMTMCTTPCGRVMRQAGSQRAMANGPSPSIPVTSTGTYPIFSALPRMVRIT